MRELVRTERGALVYKYIDEEKRRGRWAVVALVVFIVAAVLFGLPQNPMHGASKYKAAQDAEQAGLLNNIIK